MARVVVVVERERPGPLQLKHALGLLDADTTYLFMTVLRPQLPDVLAGAWGTILATPGTGDFEAAELAAQRQMSCRLSDLVDEVGVEADTLVARGEPMDRISEAATEEGADLIVIPSYGNRLLDLLIGRAPARAVARRTRCPVLVVGRPRPIKRRGPAKGTADIDLDRSGEPGRDRV